MDDRKYSTLMDAVAAVPDPRKRRGKRHPWALILTLLSAALVCGQHSGRAIGQWVEEHSVELLTQLPIPQRPLPSTSTLRRALRTLDVVALEDRLAQFAHDLDAATPPAAATPWHGQAVDGKAVRGAQAHGQRCTSLVWRGMLLDASASRGGCAIKAMRLQRCPPYCMAATYGAPSPPWMRS